MKVRSICHPVFLQLIHTFFALRLRSQVTAVVFAAIDVLHPGSIVRNLTS